MVGAEVMPAKPSDLPLPAFLSAESQHEFAQKWMPDRPHSRWSHGAVGNVSATRPRSVLSQDPVFLLMNQDGSVSVAQKERSRNFSTDPCQAPKNTMTSMTGRTLSGSVPDLVRHAERGESTDVRRLLEAGVDPNSRDDLGFTSLHVAAKKGHASVVNVLLEFAANANIQTTCAPRETPLHYACKYGREGIVQNLLACGADSLSATDEGKVAAVYAREKKHFDLADFVDKFVL